MLLFLNIYFSSIIQKRILVYMKRIINDKYILYNHQPMYWICFSSPPEGCTLPHLPEYSNYTSPLCSFNNTSSACRNIPGTYVDQKWLLLIHCNNGYYFQETGNGFYTSCTNGSWLPDIPVCRSMYILLYIRLYSFFDEALTQYFMWLLFSLKSNK